jgi:potassium/hydrogen antiporter
VDASLPIDPLVFVVSVMLAIAVLTASLSQRLQAPSALLFLGLGMLVGEDVLGLISVDDQQLVQNLGVLALVVILFEGGLTTKPTDLRRAWVPGGLLATVGVLLTAAVTGLGVYLLLGLDPMTAALLGAVVASTDAAAVFSTLRTINLPARLGAVLKFESGANDPFAVALTIGLLEYWRQQPPAAALVAFGVGQLVIGLLVGGLVGWAGSHVLRRVRLPAEGLYPVAALAIAGMAYGAAVPLGGSGFLAVYIAGLLVGGLVRRRRRGIRDFHEGLANASEIGLFLILGLLVFPSDLPDVWVPGIVTAAILTLVARPLATALCLLPARLPWREQTVIGWAGLRGAVPIVLATFPILSGYPEGRLIFDIVFFVVLLSTLVQGVSVGPLVGWLGVRAARPAWAPVAEALPIDEVEADIVEVVVTEDLPIVGQRIADVPLRRGMLMASIVRGESVLVPRGDTEICDGDLLLIVVQESEHSAERVTSWARGEVAPEPDDIAPWPPDLGLAVLEEYPPLAGGDPDDAPAPDRRNPADAREDGSTDAEGGPDGR